MLSVVVDVALFDSVQLMIVIMMTRDNSGIGQCADDMHACVNSHVFALVPALVDARDVGLVVIGLN